MMRESNNALTESMTSSMHLLRSSTSSSRQLANVPSMVNPASMSVSSSPGKPLSPHTPHTPAIPSRLSENSIIDYQSQGQQTARRQSRNPEIVTTEEEEGGEEDDDETPMITQQGGAGTGAGTGTTTSTGTTAIDIPLSPRLLHAGSTSRRASSVAQQHRSLAGEVDPYVGQRSASVEAASDDREAPSLSALLAYQRGAGSGSVEGGRGSPRPESAAGPAGGAERGGGGQGGGGDGREAGSRGGLGGEQRSRSTGGAGTGTGVGIAGVRYPVRGPRPGSFSSGIGAGRSAGSVEGADDEPLLFAMSELERDSRRSLEEGPQGSRSGNGEKGDGPRGVLRKGW
ncbi:hypothetical protein VTK56DRAFT_9672 [Thermocarpiscus australiensis]